MIIIGIDPGKTTGIVAYDSTARRVVWSSIVIAPSNWPDYSGARHAAVSVASAIRSATTAHPMTMDAQIAIEAVSLYGIVGRQIEATIRLEHELSTRGVRWRITRADALSAVGIVGSKQADARIRLYLQDQFGADGADCFERGMRCKKRKNKSHGADCLVCHGSGYVVLRGELYELGVHGRDALIVAMAVAVLAGAAV